MPGSGTSKTANSGWRAFLMVLGGESISLLGSSLTAFAVGSLAAAPAMSD